MKNLRLISTSVSSSTEIIAEFTENLIQNIGVDNVSIISETPGTPDPAVLKVSVKNNTLIIDIRPLTELSVYSVVFKSTNLVIFQSLNNDAILLEDGIANKALLIAPLEDTNAVKSFLTAYLRNNLYTLESGTFIDNYLTTLASILSKSLFSIRQARNDNYLSITITDENKVRGPGAFDRLNEEGCYEIIRVGKTPTSSPLLTSILFDSSTSVISLQSKNNSENLTLSSGSQLGTLNINDLTLNLSKQFITKLKSVIFTYSNGHLPYTYDISTFGYQILDSKYDPEFGFKFLQLSDNQVRLNSKILEDSNFSLNSIFQIQVIYEFKDTGRSIDTSTVKVFTDRSSGREVLPVLMNVFNLKHAPIVDVNGNTGAIGDISFVDQNVLNSLNTPHPAFKQEIIFRLDALPAKTGDYAVDYVNGTIYVFGASVNDGTGSTPPLAVYSYQLNFKENVDFVINETDLVILPFGNIPLLPNQQITVSFNFEEVLAEGVDFTAGIHNEVINERINNKLIAINALRTDQSPITNVFKVFNESSGETYRITRWNDNTVFFAYTTPPTISEIIYERAKFTLQQNEVMFVNNIITVSPSRNIYKILLANNSIIAQTEDCIGSIFNSSVSLSNNSIFIQEKYFNENISEATNLTKLTTLGDYQINYQSGIIYVLVTNTQDFDLGTVSYKYGVIDPIEPHVTSIEDIYYQIDLASTKNKHFDFTSFTDGAITPTVFDFADEQFLSKSDPSSFYLVSNTNVGSFVAASFVPGVANSIGLLRHIFELNDLENNTIPVDFVSSATFSGKNITINPLIRKEYHTIEFDGTNFFVILNTGLNYFSPNITLNISVFRIFNSQELWNNTGTVQLGQLIKLLIPTTNSPAVGDSVLVTYTYTINNLALVVVDYDKGGYYIDYTALTDEILVSYEYGDNVLDFRNSSALNEGDNYFVTYKAGALRDSLLNNFGSLINIDILNTFDLSLGRESYRDALMAAMHTFSKGPTVPAITELVQTISHIPPTVTEFAFNSWSLGNSLLGPRPIKVNGSPELQPLKFGNGLQLNSSNTNLQLPVVSNLRLEEGTFETWLSPEWNGIDNFANLKISVFRDGYSLAANNIFIGALEYHPVVSIGSDGYTSFSLAKSDRVIGTPNKNKDGVFIYYDNDVSGQFQRWFFDIIDGYENVDGYVVDGYKDYKVVITTDGRFYDVKSIEIPQSVTSTLMSGNNKITWNIHSLFPNQGITFVSDFQHYLLDFAEESNKNRLSIFKDESGYMNFKVFDDLKNSYLLSADVSDWRLGSLHHIAASWKLSTKMGRDEMHLFIDGFEVPNIIRYGDKVAPYLHEKYRTVNPEEIVGVVNANIVAGNDLSTVAGSALVVSSINFGAAGIVNGNTIFIEESGFNVNGYTITNVNGNTLTLSATMPSTITDGAFSVNKISFGVKTEIDIYPNIAVSLLHSSLSGNDLNTIINLNVVTTSTTNFISNNIKIGDIIRINDPAFELSYVILSVATHSLTINGNAPASLTNAQFFVYPATSETEIPGRRALIPAYEFAEDGYFNDLLVLRDKALINDIVLIRTLGLNHRRVRRPYYVWGNSGNILKTKLPAPISLDETNIYKVILPRTSIGPGNSTLSGGIFNSVQLPTDQPTNAIAGRTLAVSIIGTNIDFTTPVTVDINGVYINQFTWLPNTITETVTLTASGQIVYTTHLFTHVNYVQVHCKPVNSARDCLVVEVKEKYSLTRLEDPDVFVVNGVTVPEPVIRFSYQVYAGNALFSDGYQASDGYVVTDNTAFFSDLLLNDYLIIHNPYAVAGYYKIVGISSDHRSLTIASANNAPVPVSAFTNGDYEILHPTTFRSGLQNGYFTFEINDLPGTPYMLTNGLYELDYYTYLNLPFRLSNNDMFIGSDFIGHNLLNGTLGQLQILSNCLTDTRIGETAASNTKTITKEFNSIKASQADSSTLVLLHFDTLPIVNSADVYISAAADLLQSGVALNENFGKSICFNDKPLILDNAGILDPRKQGTIEFWLNPLFDANNDPNYRFYFDASNAAAEIVLSTNSTTIKISGRAAQILSVKLTTDKTINFFANGTLSSNGQVINLQRELPKQNILVEVVYIPYGFNGDRLSIFKDPSGFINFLITASGTDYVLRAPTFWARNTWHRIKASFTVNNGNSLDEMHLFVDGYEKSNFTFGSGFLFGNHLVFGSSFTGPNTIKQDIKFKDSVNRLFIGTDFNGENNAAALVDNLRISNIQRPLYKPFGEALDANYSSNLDTVFPITQDLYTTLLLDFDTTIIKNTDFAVLRNKFVGLSDFELTVFDSLDIINSNQVIKNVLEDLIANLKPANSRAFIIYK